jgi:AraC family transcriptional regulator
MRFADVLCVLREIRHRLDGDVSLARLAQRAGWSAFHLHRAFRSATGETPKQYTQRLRLECAAATLVASDGTVTQVARASGFASHEVFTRAFRRHFGCTPARYRVRALAGASRAERARHAELTLSISPCVRLFHVSTRQPLRTPTMPTLSITRQERPAQPVLFIRRRIARSELQGMLAECFGKLYGHAQKAGLPIAGFPLARYVSMGPGLWTVEAAVPLAAPASGEGEMQAGTLPAGPVAMGVHAGPYEQLGDTNAAIERWIEANGFRVGGAPWEWYVTDPGEYPNPEDWRTEVYWPLAP